MTVLKRIFASLTLALLMPTGGSLANVNEFKVCRETLQPPAQEILNRITSQLEPGVDPERLIRSTVIEMVKTGEIERKTAKENAMSAVTCLKKLKG